MRDRILVVAPTLPLFDLHSGDLRLFTLVKILSKSHDIAYFAHDWAGNRRVETEKYISLLNTLGIKVHVGSDSFKNAVLSDGYDLAIFEFYGMAEKYLERIGCIQPRCRTIIDTVDVHYLRLHRKYLLTGEESDLRTAEETKRRELSVYAMADIVVAVTEEDANSIRNDIPGANVRVVPNVHDLARPRGEKNRKELVFVGGFKHPPNIDAVLYFCEAVLPKVREKVPGVRFTIVGSNPPEEVKALASDHVEVTGYVPETTPYLHRSYISVAPLRYGAGMKGKVGEAMAHGLPVVSTSVGAEGMGLTDRENILIADTPEAFRDAIVELMADPGLYAKIRDKSMEHIAGNYSPEIVGRQMERVIGSLGLAPGGKASFFDKASYLIRYGIDFVERKTGRHAGN